MIINIPVVVIKNLEEELLKILLPTDALFELRTSNNKDIVLVKEGEFFVSMQKILDYLIIQKGFFETLELVLENSPEDRRLSSLILAAKDLPEN